MITKTSFRVLLVSSVACELFAIIRSSTTEGFLPAEHRVYLQKTAADVGEREIALLALGVPVLLLGILAAIGLYKFWSWARTLALAVTVLGLALFPLIKVIVELGWVGLFSDAASLLWGAVLALAYVPPIGENFVKAEAALD